MHADYTLIGILKKVEGYGTDQKISSRGRDTGVEFKAQEYRLEV